MNDIKIMSIDGEYITFASRLGHGKARWEGDKPVIGNVYSVGMDIDDSFDWNENISESSKEGSRIEFKTDQLIFIATFISYQDDGILTVSLGGGIVFWSQELFLME